MAALPRIASSSSPAICCPALGVVPIAPPPSLSWSLPSMRNRRRRARLLPPPRPGPWPPARRARIMQVWLKPSAEMSYLYGNHVLKSGLGRITEGTPAYQGVVIYSMSDVPLGFGVAAKSTQECRKLEPSAIVAFHQGDVGEYLRAEDQQS